MSCLKLFKAAFNITMRKLCRQIPLLAGLVLLSGALAVLAGQTAAGAMSEGVAFSKIILAVTAPAGDNTATLLEQYLGQMSDVRQYCQVETMAVDTALSALSEGRVTAVLSLPEAFVQKVQRGENPPVELIVDGDRPIESLLTMWVGQSAADLLTAVQGGIYTVLDAYDRDPPEQLPRGQVVTEINLRFVQRTLNRQDLFALEEISPTGSLPVAPHYTLSILCWLLLSIAPVFSWNYQGTWPGGYYRLTWLGHSVLMGLVASLVSCELLLGAVVWPLLVFGVGVSPLTGIGIALVWAAFLSAYAATCALTAKSVGGCAELSLILSLGALFLSGGVVPTVLLPKGLQALGWASPITWMRAMAAWALGYGGTGRPVLLLLAGTVALTLIGAVLYCRRCREVMA